MKCFNPVVGIKAKFADETEDKKYPKKRKEFIESIESGERSLLMCLPVSLEEGVESLALAMCARAGVSSPVMYRNSVFLCITVKGKMSRQQKKKVQAIYNNLTQ